MTVIPVVVGADGRSALVMLDGGAYLEAARYSASTGVGGADDGGPASGSYAMSGRNGTLRECVGAADLPVNSVRALLCMHVGFEFMWSTVWCSAGLGPLCEQIHAGCTDRRVCCAENR